MRKLQILIGISVMTLGFLSRNYIGYWDSLIIYLVGAGITLSSVFTGVDNKKDGDK